jgi:hypothetical protein
MNFRDLSIGDRFEFVVGPSGAFEKTGARTCVRADVDRRWATKYIGKAADEVKVAAAAPRLIEKNTGRP